MVKSLSALAFGVAVMSITCTVAVPMPDHVTIEARKFSLGKIFHKVEPIAKKVGKVGLDIAVRSEDETLEARDDAELEARKFSLGKVFHKVVDKVKPVAKKALPIAEKAGKVGLDVVIRSETLEARYDAELEARKLHLGKVFHKVVDKVKPIAKNALPIAEKAGKVGLDVVVRSETLEARDTELEARKLHLGKILHKVEPIAKKVGKVGLDVVIRSEDETLEARDADLEARFNLGKVFHKVEPVAKKVGKVALNVI